MVLQYFLSGSSLVLSVVCQRFLGGSLVVLWWFSLVSSVLLVWFFIGSLLVLQWLKGGFW